MLYIYIYIYISEVGGVSPTEKLFRVVLWRACVRARGLVVEWNFASNVTAQISLFLFGLRRLSLFP